MEIYLDHMTWVHSNIFQMQMAHLESTSDLFTCLIDVEITKESKSIVQLLMVPWKLDWTVQIQTCKWMDSTILYKTFFNLN